VVSHTATERSHLDPITLAQWTNNALTGRFQPLFPDQLPSAGLPSTPSADGSHAETLYPRYQHSQIVMSSPTVKFLAHIALAAITGAGSLAGHDIITTNLTYTRDISRILATHCTACHGNGSSIPLTNYTEVRPWAVGIKEQVLSRSMPPWGAVKGFGNLAPDYGLSQEDIMIIAAWVLGGAPEGNPKVLPKNLSAQSDASKNMPLNDALTVETRTELKAPLRVAGVRPLADSTVESAQLVAKLPDGRIEPLLWLSHFDPKSLDPRMHGSFTFRKPLILPAKTVVQSSTPLRFALETNDSKVPSPVS
jgi:hypothetical protein